MKSLSALFGAASAMAALCLAFSPVANATIVGSTYDFTTSVTGNTLISPLGGPTLHTDPANPGFCVGPPVACGAGEGLSGSFSFATVSPTSDRITFTYFGSTSPVGPGSFTIDLGNFVTKDGEAITGVTLFSGSLPGATTSVTFNGTDARFTETTSTIFDAIGGTTVAFTVTTRAVPGPIAGAGLSGLIVACGGLLALARRRRQLVV
jgi:hypothetical protein